MLCNAQTGVLTKCWIEHVQRCVLMFEKNDYKINIYIDKKQLPAKIELKC